MLLSSLTLIACGSASGDKGFKEGYAVEYKVNTDIEIADLVDNKGEKFSLTAEKEGEDDIDLSDEKVWRPKKIGVWTLVLNIKGGENKGKYAIDVTIKAPAITLDFNKDGSISYKANKEITFEEMTKDLKISSNFEEYGTITKRIYSVQYIPDGVGEEAPAPVKFTTETSYKFEKAGSYKVIFGVEAEDGQFYKMMRNIEIK